MKNILITIQFLLIFFTTTFSQVSYWEKVDSLLFARTHKIECGDSLNCIAMYIVTHPVPTLDSCLLGKVSTNGGKTWTKNFHDCYRAIQYDNCSYYWHKPEKFFFLSFPSRNRAFALLDNGKVMYSDDNGKIWKRVIIDSSLLYLFRYANKGFAMRDDSLGIVFAYYSKDSISLPKSHLYFTSNAGYNWVELIPNSEEFKQMNIFRISFPAQNVAKFIAFDSLESNYKLVSYSIISNNCSFKPIPIAKSSAIAPCIYFQNENNGWIAGIDYNQELNKFYDVIYFTSDGGESWINQLKEEKFQDRGIFHIEFLNNSIGFALADNYGYRTTNGGLNWIQLKDSSRTKFSRYFTSYAVVTPYSIVATASNGDIYRYSLDYTSIDEGFSARNSDRIEIFPNPVSTPPNTFTAKIRLRKSAIIKLKIYNTLGRLIEERCSESSSDEYEWLLSTEEYTNGVYFLRIESDSGEYLSKVFVVLR